MSEADPATDAPERIVRRRSPATVRPDPPSGQDRRTVRPDVSADDTDAGWGERPDEYASDDWYQRERPPHHGG